MPGINFVVFEAVNDAEKPVKITGLVLRAGEHEIDLTGHLGTKNLTRILEGEDYHRIIEREELPDKIRDEIGRKPPYDCVADFATRAGRWHRKRFTLDNEGVRE
jgi:hypothetical protein